MAVPGSLVVSEVTSGAICVFVLQELKRRYPQLESMQGWIMRAVSALWALVSVLIISYEWTPHEGGGGTLLLTLPSLGGAIVAIWKWAEQFAVNEVLYKGVVKPSATTPAAATKPAATK